MAQRFGLGCGVHPWFCTAGLNVGAARSGVHPGTPNVAAPVAFTWSCLGTHERTTHPGPRKLSPTVLNSAFFFGRGEQRRSPQSTVLWTEVGGAFVNSSTSRCLSLLMRGQGKGREGKPRSGFGSTQLVLLQLPSPQPRLSSLSLYMSVSLFTPCRIFMRDTVVKRMDSAESEASWGISL